MDLRLVSTTYKGNIRNIHEEVIPFIDDGGREEQLINLYPQVKYQKMEGFGGAITDSAAYIYSLMSPEQKKQMLMEYFGQDSMKYRFVRIPIDSCDFSLEHYEADGCIRRSPTAAGAVLNGRSAELRRPVRTCSILS